MSKTKSLLTITCLLLLLTLSAKAQQAITPAGGNATGSGGSMSYTIGQIDFVMAVSTGGSMAQGVQHPYSDATTTGPIVGPSHLCEGASTTYTNITHGGIWTSGNTAVATIGSATGILNSLSGGVTIISYYVPGSGSIAVFANVTVDTLPNTGIITGPSSVCAGSQITLSNVPVDGTWSAAAPGILTIGIDNGIVTGIAAGAAMVTYVATNACGQDSAVATITVDPLPDAGSISGAASMCEGDTITLTNSSGGGTWSSGASGIAVVGSPGIVFGISGGNTTISYTVTNGCGNDYATHLLSVNPLVPDAGIITGPNSVVIDSTITLTNATGSGTWNASNANVTISPSGVVTGVSAGTVVISYTIGTECGSNVATKIVTVNVPLGPITGTLTLCQGTTTTLSSTVAGGSWFTSNFSVAAVSGTGVVTGASAGTATITYILSTNYVTATVTVYPLPAAITGAGSVCAGSTIILSSTTPDGVWSSSLPEIATIDAVTGIVTGIIAGTVVISYTPGCSVTRIITVNAAPNAGTISGTTTMCVAANRTLSSTVSGGTWSSSATSIATIGTSGIVTGVSAGTALISYIVTNSCGSVFDTVIVTIHAPGAGTITGSSSVNTGSIITLTNTTTGGTWSSSNTAIATVGSTGVVAGVSPGTVTISYSVSNSCGSTSATKIVSVNVLLETPITGTFTVCTGATTTLSNATPGGTWSSGNTAVATVVAGTGVVTGISAGTAVISYTLFGTSVTTIITVNAAMSVASITGTSSFCAGATSALASTTTGGTWSSSNTTIATVGSTGIVAGISGGTAGITYTATGICGTGYAVMIVE
ncbi:MAG: hypothetical protein K9G49_12515, partial [Taibaiella sp.]|nr:hypothetical protein [Taibaiella sp.]